MGATESRTLLERIGSGQRDSARKNIIALFDKFDRDHSGRIEGYEIGSLVESISLYIWELLGGGPLKSSTSPECCRGASPARGPARRTFSPCTATSPNSPENECCAVSPCATPRSARPPPLHKIRSWVILSLDVDRNGVITRDELIAHLPGILGEANAIAAERSS